MVGRDADAGSTPETLETADLSGLNCSARAPAIDLPLLVSERRTDINFDPVRLIPERSLAFVETA